MEIELTHNTLPVIHALDSDTRINIINLLSHHQMTVTELANTLHYSKAIISKHIQILRDAQIVYDIKSSDDHRQKALTVRSDNILITLPEKIYPNYQYTTYDIPLGNYFSTDNISATCGLASSTAIIGEIDNSDVFLSAKRLSADLLWFSYGQIEYVVPNPYKEHVQPEMIDISFEISSEFPKSNNNWPSDISFWLNDINIGTWTVPGNYSDIRGRLTPTWWDSDLSQYGVLKHLRIQQNDTGIDGIHLSNHNLSELGLDNMPNLHFKIGIDSNSANQGGLTIFGKTFGNYPQNIRITCYYSSKEIL